LLGVGDRWEFRLHTQEKQWHTHARIGRVLSYWLLFYVLAAAFTFLLASGFDLVIVMGVACGFFFVLFCLCGNAD